jgi:hypothetical protein
MRTVCLATAAALLCASATSAAAEPWRLESYTINPGTFHSATQFDAKGDYAMVIECHEETGRFELFVESPYDWDLEASYAPEVPAVLNVGGVDVTDVRFYFDEKQLGEGIRADTADAAFGRLLDRMIGVGDYGEIGLSYFDRTASFPTEGLVDAILSLGNSCL